MIGRLPWWVKVALIFVASRLLTTAILVVTQALTEGRVDLVDYSNQWDGYWYHLIATQGYPSVLPRDHNGYVAQNDWAFMPAYPYLVQGVAVVTRLPWTVVAPILSTVLALVASLLLHRLLRRTLPEGTALFGVLLFLVLPPSVVLQTAYAESMQLALLFLTLLLVLDRRYLLTIPVVVLMSFTRPTGIAVALFLLVHLVARWLRRREEPFGWGQRLRLIAAGLASAVAGLAWIGVAAIATGRLTAYVDTESVWHHVYVHDLRLEPFLTWPATFTVYVNHLVGRNALGVALGWTVVLVMIALLVLLLAGPWRRRIALDLRLWIGSWGVYLLAVFFPQSSVFRLLMPMAPASGILALPRSRVYRVVAVVLAVAAQIGWVLWCWVRLPMDITPP